MKNDEASAVEGFDLGRMLFQQSQALAAQREAGIEDGRMIERRKNVNAIIAAYDDCLASQPDAGKVIITTALHSAIEKARK